MNENLQKLYDVLVRDGYYTKSYDEFQTKWNDEGYRQKVYGVVSRDGLYTKDYDAFTSQYSVVEPVEETPQVKKKDATESASGDGLSVYQKISGGKTAISEGLAGKYDKDKQEPMPMGAMETSLVGAGGEPAKPTDRIPELDKEQREELIEYADKDVAAKDLLDKVLNKWIEKKVELDETERDEDYYRQLLESSKKLRSEALKEVTEPEIRATDQWVKDQVESDAFGRSEDYFRKLIDAQPYLKEKALKEATASPQEKKKKQAMEFTKDSMTALGLDYTFVNQMSPEEIDSFISGEVGDTELFDWTGNVGKEWAWMSHNKKEHVPGDRSSLLGYNFVEAAVINPNGLGYKYGPQGTDEKNRAFEVGERISPNVPSYARGAVADIVIGDNIKYAAEDGKANKWFAKRAMDLHEWNEAIAKQWEGYYAAVEQHNNYASYPNLETAKKAENDLKAQKAELLKKQRFIDYASERLSNLRVGFNDVYNREYLKKKEQEGSFAGGTFKSFYDGIVSISKGVGSVGLDVMMTIPGVADVAVSNVDAYEMERAGGDVQKAKASAVKRQMLEIFDDASGAMSGVSEEYMNSEDRGTLQQGWNAAINSIGTAVSGGGAGNLTKAAFFAMSYNQFDKEMSSEEFDSMSTAQKMAIAGTYGMVVSSLERFGFKMSTGALKNFKGIDRFVAETLDMVPKGASPQMIQRAIDNNLAAKMGSDLLKIEAGALVETATEDAQLLGEIAIKQLSNKLNDYEYFQNVPSTFDEIISAVWEETKVAFVAAQVFGFGGAAVSSVRDGISNKTSDLEFEVQMDMLMDDQLRSQAYQAVGQRIANGDLTKEEGEAQINAMKEMYSVLQSMPEEMTTRQKRDSFNLITERNRLQEEVKNKEKSLVDNKIQRINEINEELKLISKQDAVQEQGTAEVSDVEASRVSEEVEEGAPATEPEVVTEEGKKEEIESKAIEGIPVEEIQSRRKETEQKLRDEGVGELFIGATLPTGAREAAVVGEMDVVNDIAVAQYFNEKTGLLDVVISGRGDNSFVGYYRIYENGNPTNRWSSKFENVQAEGETKQQSKEAFKTMISSVQERLPSSHEYTEKTSISTDGLRVWGDQIGRGTYEILRDEEGNIVTDKVYINGDAKVNEFEGVEVNQGAFQNIRVKTQEQFNSVKKALSPYLERLGLDPETVIRWNKPQNTPPGWNGASVAIDLPILVPTSKKTKSQTTTEEGKKDQVAIHLEKGGSSISQDGTNLVGKPGYSVSIHTDRTKKIAGKEVTQAQLDEFKNKNEDLLSDKSNFVGTWYDTKTDTTYLDISTYVEDKGTAIKMAQDANQKAIYDLETLNEIDTGGTGEVTQATNQITADNELEFIQQAADKDIKTVKAAGRIAKALDKLGVKIFVHKTTNEYNQAIAKSVGTNKEAIDAETMKSRGEFITGKNEIHINLENADAKTVFHEAFHAIVMAKGIDSKAINKFVADVKKSAKLPAEMVERLDEFANQYAAGEINEEFLSELVGELASRAETMSPTGLQRLINAINKLFSAIGIKRVLRDSASRQETIDFLNGISESLRKGIDVGTVVNPAVADKVNRKMQIAPGNKLFNEPLDDAKRIADKYMTDNNMEIVDVNKINKVDKARAKRISDEYEKMANDPTNTEVAEAYEDMAKETLAQYEYIVAEGYVVEINNNEPYSSSGEMIQDLKDNKRMKIFSTESGFGDEPITEAQRKENVLLRDSGKKDVNGQALLVNDVFRFVHDFFGHAKLGNGFGPIGEENAWRVHSVMYTDKARRAMTSETRGQNSWVNFSGVNEEVFKKRDQARELRKEGKTEEADRLVGEVYDEMSFAEQKNGLMPEWTATEGAPVSRKKQITWKDTSSSELNKKDLNAARTAIRNRDKNSSTLQILDEVAKALRGDDFNLPFELDYLADGITYNDLASLVIDEGMFETLTEAKKFISDRIISKDLPSRKKQISGDGKKDSKRIETVNKAKNSYDKAKETGKNDQDSYNTAITALENSTWYNSANDIQRESAVRQLREKIGIKETSSPSVAKILGKPKDKKITVNERVVLAEKLKAIASAERTGRLAEKKARKMIADELSVMFKGLGGKVNTRKMAAVVKRALSMNLSTPVMEQRFFDYVNKVIKDVEYGNKLEQAYKIRKAIKRLSKNQQLGLSTMARTFISFDPAIVEDIDKYIGTAQRVVAGLKATKLSGMDLLFRDKINISGVTAYSMEQLRRQEKISKDMIELRYPELFEAGIIDRNDTLSMMRAKIAEMKSSDILDVMEESEVRKEVANKIEGDIEALKEMLETGYNPYTMQNAELSKQDREAIEQMLELDPDKLTVKELFVYSDMITNIANNIDTGNLDAFVREINGTQNAYEFLKKAGKSQVRTQLGRTYINQFGSLDLLLENVFASSNAALEFMAMSGLSETTEQAIRSQVEVNKFVDEYISYYMGSVIKKGKKPNGKNFADAENIYERGMYAFLIRSKGGDIIDVKNEFERRRGLILQTIDYLNNSKDTKENKKGKIYEKVAKKLDLYNENITALDIEAKTDKINRSAVNWWIDKWGEHYEAMAATARLVYNKELPSDINYTSDRFKKRSGMYEKEEGEVSLSGMQYGPQGTSIFADESGALMDTKNPTRLPSDRFIDLDFDMNQAKMIEEAIIDSRTAASIRQVKGFTSSQAFSDMFKNVGTENLVRNRITDYINSKRKKNFGKIEDLDGLKVFTNVAAKTGAVFALASTGQAFKQTVPIALSTILNSGVEMPSFIDAFNSDYIKWLEDNGSDLAMRGLESDIAVQRAEKNLEKSQQLGRKLAKVAGGLGDVYLSAFLKYPDVYIARASFLAYYKQGLKRYGLKEDIDFTKPMNKQASRYANMMVTRMQNVSDPDKAGKFWTNKSFGIDFLRKTTFTFANFIMNQKARTITDIKKISTPKNWRSSSPESLNSTQDRNDAIRSLASTGLEMTTYYALAAAVRMLYRMYSDSSVGGDESEEDEAITRLVKQENKNRIARGEAPLAPGSQEERDFRAGLGNSDLSKKILWLRWEKEWKTAITSGAKDVFSPIPATDKPTVQLLNYLLREGGKGSLKKEIDEAIEVYANLQGMRGEEITDLERERIEKQVIEENSFQMWDFNDDTYAKSYGTIGIAVDKYVEYFEAKSMADNGAFENNKGDLMFLMDEDVELAKDNKTKYALYMYGVLPADVGSIARYNSKRLKERALTLDQYVDYKHYNDIIDHINKRSDKKIDRITRDEWTMVSRGTGSFEDVLKASRGEWSEEYILIDEIKKSGEVIIKLNPKNLELNIRKDLNKTNEIIERNK